MGGWGGAWRAADLSCSFAAVAKPIASEQGGLSTQADDWLRLLVRELGAGAPLPLARGPLALCPGAA